MSLFHVWRARFKPRIKWTLLTLMLMAFLIGLGFWQLHRAKEKEAWLQLAKNQATASPLTWRIGMPAPHLFQRLILHGHYLPYTLLLDNQYSLHQWGYHVLNPLEVAQDEVILVDRGWVLGDLQRRVLPFIKIPKGALSIQGQVYYPSLKGFVLGTMIEVHGDALAVIERVDIKLISNLLHKKVYPFMIHLNPLAPFGYVRDWPIVSMPPQRHYAYALQWFAMALVLVIIYLALSFKKTE